MRDDPTHCTKHGLKLDRITLREAVNRSWFFKVMKFFTEKATYYNKYGEERIVLVCPKNDFLIEE